MQKFSLELPKVRLEFNYRLVKRRKPLVDEPMIPSVKTIKRKYRTGSLAGRFVRHISEHKNTKKILAGNLAAIVIATTFLPVAKASEPQQIDAPIITSQTPLATQKAIQLPLGVLKINQGFSFFHPGVDLGASVGSSVKAVKAGEVIAAGYTKDGYGNTILIDHGNGLTSRYAHLSKIEVKVGEVVDMNMEIGKVGLTGHTTGPHLHLEIRQNGVPLNPLSVINP